jgi:Flp pilus assembly protein TadD
VQIMVGRKDLAGAAKTAGVVSDQYPTNAILQNELAWTLTTAKDMDEQGLALAEKIAERANKAANGKVSGILDTLARTQFMTGQTNEAVDTEQKAVDIAPEDSKPYLQKFLDSYKQGQLLELRQ